MTERSARVIFFSVGADLPIDGLMRSDRVLEEESVRVFAGCSVAFAAADAIFSRAFFSAQAFLLAVDFSARVRLLDGADFGLSVVRD